MELKTQILPAILEVFFAKHPNLAMAKVARFEAFRATNDKGYVVSFTHIGNPDGPGWSATVMDTDIEEHKANFGMGRVEVNHYQVRHHGRTLQAKVGPLWSRETNIRAYLDIEISEPAAMPEDWELIDIYDEAGESVLKTYYDINQGEIDDLLEAVIDTQELVQL